jgi:PhnB protein
MDTNNDHNPRPAVPDGYATVAPWLISADTKGLIKFLGDAFDGEQLALMEGPDGVVGHAEVRIGDFVVLLFDTPKGWPDTPSHLRLYVADGDAAFARAVAAGAEPVTRMTELFWGDRVGRVRDAFGNIWWIQQQVTDLEPDEVERRAAQPDLAGAMAYVQDSLVKARS